MSDLIALEGKVPLSPRNLPPVLTEIITPLKVEAWRKALSTHPDRRFCQYITDGLEKGFRIGFNYNSQSIRSAKSNMRSATQHPQVVSDYITRECMERRMLELQQQDQVDGLQISRFGVIPKKNQPGKWRLITDLSSPNGASVNDGIDPALCSLAYASIDDAAAHILTLGKGTLLAKLDIKSAYRTVPVHPDDRPLLAVSWQGKVYIDTALPFGLRSAPKIFNSIADALEWIIAQAVADPVLHYLDDFLFFGAPKTDNCYRALRVAKGTCTTLGAPLAEEKSEGPSVVLPFLGIEVDTEALELRLPAEKLLRLKTLLASWQGKKVCTKRELLSLIGHLQHACKVIKPGRTFLRRMIDLSTSAKELHHHIRLNLGFRSDLCWWATFLQRWNGVGMLATLGHQTPQVTVLSDASGRWGCAAFCGSDWFQFPWQGRWEEVHITIKELLPIVVAGAIWGSRWSGLRIQCLCDNAAVVPILNSGSSKHPLAMHLMRSLFFISAHFKFTLVARHIPGRHNQAADALSRDNQECFFSLVPQANVHPTPIPPGLLGLLLLHTPDWTSESWRLMFSSFIRRV